MNKENLQMMLSLAIVAFLSTFNAGVRPEAVEQQTAIIADSIDESLVENTEPSIEPQAEETPNSDGPAPEELFDSLSDEEIGKEFEDVQGGLDLLENPLQ